MPKVKDIFSKVNGAKYFPTLDLWAGYHYIFLYDASIPNTTFASPVGKYEYLKVPSGLAKAPDYFQELMNKVLKDMPFAIPYLSDIIIYNKTAEEHLKHLQQVFQKLQHAELSMKLSKCHIFAKEIQYLAHILSEKGIKPLPLKMEVIKVMKPPRNATQLWVFLGFMDYYQNFIKNFAHMAKPLTMIMWHDVKFTWTQMHQTAFETLKGSTEIGTNITLHRPLTMIYSGHRCFRWYLWSPIVPGTWWTGIASQVSITHIHRNLMKIEHPKTGSLLGILCHNQVELLPPRFRYIGKNWLQTIAEVPQWEEC